jgi:hypothetical protein
MTLTAIDIDDARLLPEALPFRKYVIRAAERRAVAITLDGSDFRELARMVREAQAVLSAAALDTSDLDAFVAAQPPLVPQDPNDVLSRLDDLIAQIKQVEDA